MQKQSLDSITKIHGAAPRYQIVHMSNRRAAYLSPANLIELHTYSHIHTPTGIPKFHQLMFLHRHYDSHASYAHAHFLARRVLKDRINPIHPNSPARTLQPQIHAHSHIIQQHIFCKTLHESRSRNVPNFPCKRARAENSATRNNNDGSGYSVWRRRRINFW